MEQRLPCALRGGAVSLLTEGASPSDPAMPGHLPHLADAKQGRLFFVSLRQEEPWLFFCRDTSPEVSAWKK